MEQSSSSKVTVEYHDPSSVFPLIAKELANRLPLRNLNWQSTTRPLRQIKHLHVEFVPDAATDEALRPPPPRVDGEKPTSIDIFRSGADARGGSSKERRHQIPGLKTTPYLKLYILRCDDKNWYKQEERQKLKAWVRDVVPTGNKQEQHDAYQWLIVHVVLPDTVAGSEPRWRESTKDPDELKERSKGSNAKWPGKPPKTVFDRLRSDFNDGKLEGQHIAQVRLSKSQVSIDLLPVPALARTMEETAEEREKSWSDLMTKIRTAILTSFDARVRQYEADIAEQESRQSLPGWNFCTFFIHKEGLARALESVGLLEDALTIYDELALGLETIIVDLATGRAAQTATSFPPTSREVIERILGTSSNSANSKNGAKASSRRLFDNDYRSEIVRSAISVFDFFCYLFDRQTALILRLSGRSSSTRSESGIRESGEDLVMLAEICWRGLNFIHNGARSLKQDLADSNKDLSTRDIHSLATSWTFSAADFVLERTYSTHLDLTDTGIKSPGKVANGHTAAIKKDFGFGMGADAHPARTSSLPSGISQSRSRAAELKSDTSASSTSRVSEDGLFTAPNSFAAVEIPAEIPGLAELGAYRAELIVMKRKMLEELAYAKGWSAGWASVQATGMGIDGLADLSAVGLSHADTDSTHHDSEASTMVGVDAAELLSSQTAFYVAFESLTETAIRHFLSATHSKSAEKLMGDLAVLKFNMGDFYSADTFFEHASSLYQDSGWSYMDVMTIVMRTVCLEKLDKHIEALICASSLVSRIARRRMQHLNSASDLPAELKLSRSWDLSALAQRSATLREPVNLPLLDFFANVDFAHAIGHLEGEDGFTYHLTCKHVFDTPIVLDEVTVRLVSAADNTLEINMHTSGPITLTQGTSDIEVRSKSSTLGLYLLDSLQFHIQRLVFTHKLTPKTTSPLELTQATNDNDEGEETRPSLLLYPASEACDAEIRLAKTTALHRSRKISITIDSGWNDITAIDVKLKPASAGLRIHTTDMTLDGIEVRQDSSFRTGVLQLGPLPRKHKATVAVRVSLEQAKPEMLIKAEVNYRTHAGDFTLLIDARLPTQLPVDVEVIDVFRQEALFSTFVMRTMDGVPMHISDIELRGTSTYHVISPPVARTPALILPGQAVDCAYQIKKAAADKQKKNTSLELNIACILAKDAVREAISTVFSKDLQLTSFMSYRRLLMSMLEKRLSHTVDAKGYTVAMLMEEVKAPSFADIGWFEIIDSLPLSSQRPLSDWLMMWHIKHQRIPLNINTLLSVASKQVSIAVEMPSLDYLFTVTLKKSMQDSPLVIGQPLQLQLIVSVSRTWSRAEDKAQQDFIYELHVLEDVWMLGGQRRARISPSSDEQELAIEVTLIPLKTGLWSLPDITVKPVEHSDATANQQKPLSCETNVTYAGLVVQVVHDRRRTAHVVFEETEE